MTIAAVIISTLALLFTVISFWWMNWRKGKLHVSEPRTYAIGSMPSRLSIHLPFTFFNDGPLPIVIENLRLSFSDDEGKPLTFMSTMNKIGETEAKAWPTQFIVLGREAIKLICEFQRDPGGITFAVQKYPMKLEAKLDDKREWVKIGGFTLNVDETDLVAINAGFRVHDNMSVD